MCLTARKPNLRGLATMPPTIAVIATEYLACGLFFIDVLGLPIELDFTVTEVQISFQFNWVFTPLDFCELLFSKNNCLNIFFLPHLDF